MAEEVRALARLLTFPHVTRDRTRRTVGLGLAGAGALLLSIWPPVVLTDPRGSYYPARAEALVGAPHLVETVRRCGEGRALEAREALQVAAELCRFSAQ